MHGKCDAKTDIVAIDSGIGVLMQHGQHPYITGKFMDQISKRMIVLNDSLRISSN